MIEDDSNITGSDFLSDLSWQITMGADECIQEVPVNRYEAVAAKLADRLAAQKAAQDAVMAKAKPQASPTPSRAAVSHNAPLGAAEAIKEAKTIAAASNDLVALEQAILNFNGCALKQTAGNTVFGDGRIDADILFVGEAPGDEDDKHGKPFMGGTGQMLSHMLSFIGLNRENAYYTNMLYWRPPGKRTPTDAEIATCLPLLKRHIQLVNPKVIILLGKIPANTLFDNKDSIKRLRGKWITYKSDDMDAGVFNHGYFLRCLYSLRKFLTNSV